MDAVRHDMTMTSGHPAVQHIHIFGASGSGTSTLGAALMGDCGYTHIDTDDYYWQPTHPPFQQPRDRTTRQAFLGSALDASPRWVLTGSLCGWGDVFIPRFDLVVFLYVPGAARLARLRERERQRYGVAVEPGGAMHEASAAFLDWAAAYDDGGLDIRSRALHEKWLASLSCRLLRLEGDRPVADHIAVLRPIITRV